MFCVLKKKKYLVDIKYSCIEPFYIGPVTSSSHSLVRNEKGEREKWHWEQPYSAMFVYHSKPLQNCSHGVVFFAPCLHTTTISPKKRSSRESSLWLKITPKWILLRSLLFPIPSFCIPPNRYYADLSKWVAPKLLEIYISSHLCSVVKNEKMDNTNRYSVDLSKGFSQSLEIYLNNYLGSVCDLKGCEKCEMCIPNCYSVDLAKIGLPKFWKLSSLTILGVFVVLICGKHEKWLFPNRYCV